MVRPALQGKSLIGTKESCVHISGLCVKLETASGPDGNPRISGLDHAFGLWWLMSYFRLLEMQLSALYAITSLHPRIGKIISSRFPFKP